MKAAQASGVIEEAFVGRESIELVLKDFVNEANVGGHVGPDVDAKAVRNRDYKACDTRKMNHTRIRRPVEYL